MPADEEQLDEIEFAFFSAPGASSPPFEVDTEPVQLPALEHGEPARRWSSSPQAAGDGARDRVWERDGQGQRAPVDVAVSRIEALVLRVSFEVQDTHISECTTRGTPHCRPSAGAWISRKTRLVIRKTTTIYQSSLVPFPSVLVGFNVANVKLGYDPYASAQVSTSAGRTFDTDGSARLVASGIETSKALITVEEDASSTRGVPSSFDFAILLYIPERRPGAPESELHPDAFEAALSVEASLGKGSMQETWARFLGSPREW
ncbi:hypothetical protein RQP46_004977 [Phenoliferia psychrophenolica]